MSTKLFTDNRILSKIGKEPVTPAFIAERVKCSITTISRALPRLYEDGLIEKVEIKGANGKTISGWYSELNKHRRK
jgi:predicted transcriptional regulator